MPSPLGRPEALLSIAMGGLFFLISGLTFDPRFVWMGALAPLPILWAFLRFGPAAGLLAALVGGAAHLLLLSPELGIVSALVLAGLQGLLPALMMGAAVSAGAAAGIAVTAGASGQVGAQVLLLVLMKQQAGNDPIGMLTTAVQESALLVPPELLAAQGTNAPAFAQDMVQLIQLLLPGLIVLGAFMSAAATYLVARLLLPRLGCMVPAITPVGQWRMPTLLGWAWLLTFLSWGFGDFGRRIGSNVFLILSSAYWLQGLSVGYFLLSQRIPRAISGLAVIVAGIPAMWIVTLLGVSDSVFNFRRLGPHRIDRRDAP